MSSPPRGKGGLAALPPDLVTLQALQSGVLRRARERWSREEIAASTVNAIIADFLAEVALALDTNDGVRLPPVGVLYKRAREQPRTHYDREEGGAVVGAQSLHPLPLEVVYFRPHANLRRVLRRKAWDKFNLRKRKGLYGVTPATESE